MKIFLLFIIGFFFLNSILAQTKTNTENEFCVLKNLSFIDNNKIKYSIYQIIRNDDTCMPYSVIGFNIVVDFSHNERDIVEKLNRECWIKLLNNRNTDWAANLILYDLHKKDAFALMNKGTRKLWLKYLKPRDLIYWKKRAADKIEY